MAFKFDIHLHTSRYSRDSRLDPVRLIRQAARAGLDGVVITEHHHMWTQTELDELIEQSDEPGFVLLSGFEYTSSHGDVLIYGASPEHVKDFEPGRSPEWAIERAHALGAVCIAAHPTRAGLGFDERILELDLDAIEVQSMNLKMHEQRRALQLAQDLDKMPTASSDAHRIEDVGAYYTEFVDSVQTMADLKDSIKRGRFRLMDAKQSEAALG